MGDVVRIGVNHVALHSIRMRISSPGTQDFPGNSLFQLFLQVSPISSHSRKKRRHFGGGDKNYHPRVVHALH